MAPSQQNSAVVPLYRCLPHDELTELDVVVQLLLVILLAILVAHKPLAWLQVESSGCLEFVVAVLLMRRAVVHVYCPALQIECLELNRVGASLALVGPSSAMLLV